MSPRLYFLLASALLVWLAFSLPAHAQSTEVHEAPSLRGQMLAEAMIRKGQLEIITYGMQLIPKSQAAYQARYDALLAKHGIKIVNRGCIVVNSLAENSFNSRMQKEIATRYGPNFLTDLRERARGGVQVVP